MAQPDLSQQVANLTGQLQALAASTNFRDQQINSVSIKLPEFWTKSPEVWFARVEAQFNTKNITQDQTRYDYVVSSLDINTAEEIQSLLVNPPQLDKYGSLKKALTKTFGKSQTQKDTELLNLNGLGDKRPTALLRKINALNDDPVTLKRALFLMNLPPDIRGILAGHNIADPEELAEAADRIWETRMSGVQHISSPPFLIYPQHDVTTTPPLPQSEETVAAIKTVRQRGQPLQHSGSTPNSICYYHQRFGPDARRCQDGCKFSSLLKLKGNKQNSLSSGNASAGR